MVPESPIAIPQRELEFTRDAEKIISEYASELSEGKIKLVELVEKLGNYMTDLDEFRRYQGTYILSEVLSQQSPKLLDSNETSKLVNFYCDRVKDHFIILPVVLKGLNALMGMENINSETPLTVLSTLSDNVVCQSLSQANRFNYYSLFKLIAHNHKEAFADKNVEFVRYLVNAMDGENDPRNLMLLFRLIPNVLRHCSLTEATAEEMFLVLECYFPVDFTPSSKFTITREDLKEGLEDCLTATRLFFPLCLPLILEKLDSKLKVAHVDSLHLLMRQCRMWGSESLTGQLGALWTSMKELIFSAGDAEVSNLAIQTLAVVVSSAANSPSMQTQLNDCLESVTGIKTLLLDASLNLFPLAMRMLAALALASPYPAEYIITSLLPHLLDILEHEKSYKDVVLSSLLPIITASVNFDLWKFSKPEVKSLVVKLPDVMFKYIEVQKLRPCCTEGFKILLPVLNENQRNRLYSVLHNFETGDEKTCDEESKLIKDIANLYPDEITSKFLDSLSAGDEEKAHSRNVHLLSWSSHILPVTEYCCNKIISFMELEKFPKTTVHIIRKSCEAIENVDVLKCMGGEGCRIIDRLLDLYSQNKLPTDDKEVIVDLAKIFQRIVSSMDASNQSELVERCLKTHFSQYTVDDQSLSLPSYQVVLVEGILGSLHCDVTLPKLDSVLHSLIFISYNSEYDLCRLSSSRLISSIFNKNHNDALLEYAASSLDSEIENKNSHFKSCNAVNLISWICKALVLSNHPSHSLWLDRLFSLLTSKELCMEVPKGFKIILTESEEYLNRQCHAKIGILYRQRVFENISKLIDLQDGVEGVCRSAVNLTISYFLKLSPPQLVINRLTELIKIIVRCLDNDDANVSLSTLEVISSLLATKNIIFEDYIDDLIPRCLKLSNSGSMDIKIAAFQCLCLYTQYKQIILLPYQKKVIAGLAKCLDDNKRLVRKKAVETRCRWYLLDAV